MTPSPSEKPAFLTLPQVSAECCVPVGTLRHWIQAGRLRAYKPGRSLLIRRADLDALIEGSEISHLRAERARARRVVRERVKVAPSRAR